mmetsp:Transcript_106315/g.227023  ORF Transcript_106315/g.227023 Transcript_106315/m.227023 type:complete len:232 (+) Transcript_106315:1132-1827(+)
MEELIVCDLVRLQATSCHLSHQSPGLLGFAAREVSFEHGVEAHDIDEVELLHLLEVLQGAIDVIALHTSIEVAVIDQGAQLSAPRAEAVEDRSRPGQVAVAGVRLDHRGLALKVGESATAGGCIGGRRLQGGAVVGEALGQGAAASLGCDLHQGGCERRIRPSTPWRHLELINVTGVLESIASDECATSACQGLASGCACTCSAMESHDTRNEFGILDELASLEKSQGERF